MPDGGSAPGRRTPVMIAPTRDKLGALAGKPRERRSPSRFKRSPQQVCRAGRARCNHLVASGPIIEAALLQGLRQNVFCRDNKFCAVFVRGLLSERICRRLRQPMATHVPVEPKSFDFERRTIALAPISRLCVEPHGSSSHASTDRNSTGNGRAACRTSGDTASDTRQSNGAAT